MFEEYFYLSSVNKKLKDHFTTSDPIVEVNWRNVLAIIRKKWTYSEIEEALYWISTTDKAISPDGEETWINLSLPLRGKSARK